MASETGAKRGLQSAARKRASSRHVEDPAPAAAPVPGAFGRGPRRPPARARRRRPPIASVNPATGEMVKVFEPHSERETATRVARAAEAFAAYRRVPFAERARMMRRVADILDEERAAFGRLITTEMGKPLNAAVGEVAKCAWVCRHYAEHAESLLADERVDAGAGESFVRYQPLGPILAVMPWNFPFWQVFRFAAPALMAGNVVLLKHAANVPQCGLAIEHVFTAAGSVEGVFTTLLLTSDQVGRLLDDDRVVAATLTGSEGAGSAVAGRAGAQVKKTVLELGGSDPFVVLPSADLEAAVSAAVEARTVNNGQSCIAAKRFVVAEPAADEFERRFVDAMAGLTVGDPLDPSTEIGPLATADTRDRLEDQVRRTVEAGARVLTGGRRLDRPGFYYAPTVLTDVPAGSPAHREELFGPVATLFRARDAEDALRIANDTRFGLGASIWTREAAERDRFVDGLESGLVFVNGIVASDPRLPFGGVKRSGYGRELGVWGLREFVNIKTVRIAAGAPEPDGRTVE